MISFMQAKELLPNAVHLYVGVTAEQIAEFTGQKYVSEVEGTKLLGTMDSIPGLKELVAGTMSFS